MVSPSMTDSKEKKPRAKPRARKPNISLARKKQDTGRNVEVAMRTFEENIRGKNNNSGEKNPIIGEIMYTFKDKNVPVSGDTADLESALDVVKEFVNICTVSVTARLVTDDDELSKVTPVRRKRAPAKPKKPPAVNIPNEPKISQSELANATSAECLIPPVSPESQQTGTTQSVLNSRLSRNYQPKPAAALIIPVKREQPELTLPKPFEHPSPVCKPSELNQTQLPSYLADHLDSNPTAPSSESTLNEPKVHKEAAALKVPRNVTEEEPSQVLCADNRNSATPCSTKLISNDLNSSEVVPHAGDSDGIQSTELTQSSNQADEFDFLSRPRKKRISFYSQHKQAYGSKYNLQIADSVNKKEMTMHDLIFYNPTTNPMSNSKPPAKKNSSPVNVKEEVIGPATSRLEEEAVDDVDDVDAEMPVPQLKLSADGTIILDPKSLVVQTSGEKSLKALENSSVIEEDGSTVNRYSKAKKKYLYWTPLETLRFYRALNTIGTDFSLMQTVFPDRTRCDLKKKFKKEERTNRELIDKALVAAAEFDVDMLEEDIRKDAERAEAQRKAKEELARKKKEEKEERKILKKYSKNKSIKNLMEGDTGHFENKRSASIPAKRGKRGKARKTPRDPLALTESSEEDEPDFDSLYPSDDDLILHTDHTYSAKGKSRKKFKFEEREDSECEGETEKEVVPTEQTDLLTESEPREVETSIEACNLCENEFLGTNKERESSLESIVQLNSKPEGLSNGSQSIDDTPTSYVILHEGEYKLVSNPSMIGVESSSKSIPLYGNRLIGINNESESETDQMNEEKENENLNVNDTVTVNEYVIISDIGEIGNKSFS